MYATEQLLLFGLALVLFVSYFGVGFLIDSWIEHKLPALDSLFYYKWYVVLNSITVFFWPVVLVIWIPYLVRKGMKHVPHH